MKKEMKLASVILIGFMFLSLFAGITAAVTALPDPLQSLSTWWNSLGSFDTNETFIKVLFGILIALIVFAISEFLPFMTGKPTIQGLFSIIVAILATSFLVPQEIYTALFAYKILGISLLIIIPFIILVIFSIQLGIKHPEQAWISTIFWILASLIFVIKFIFTLFNTIERSQLGSFGLILYGAIILISIIFAFASKGIIKIFFKEKLKSWKNAAEMDAAERELSRKAERADLAERMRGIREKRSNL